jgi:putative ABC transport system substrate-binding protein
LAALADELVRTKPEVIIATSTGARAVQQASKSIPIVIPITFDPVREGFATSLAHPGGNTTGISALLEDIFPKHVELLKAAMPKLSRIAVMVNPGFVEHPLVYKKIEANARRLGIEARQVSARSIGEIDPALAAAVNEHAQALIILGNSAFVQQFRHIAEFARMHRLATIYSGRELPRAGGLMSYGPDFRDNYRRAAGFVDRILKGSRPADMPFEQPTTFELTINLRTAKAIGVDIPQDLRARADEVIE